MARERTKPPTDAPGAVVRPGVLVIGWLAVLAYVAMLGWHLAALLAGGGASPSLATLRALIALPGASASAAPAWLAWVNAGAASAALLVLLLCILATPAALRARTGKARWIPPPAARAAQPEPGLPGADGSPATAAATPAPTTPIAAVPPPAFDPRIFISHSSSDDAFCQRLVGDLRAAFGDGAVWYDHAPMRDADHSGGLIPGDRFAEEIVHQLGSHNVLVVVLSPAAVTSGWVKYEIEQGLVRYLSPAREYAVILPVMCRATQLPDLLRIFHYADMTSAAGDARGELTAEDTRGELTAEDAEDAEEGRAGNSTQTAEGAQGKYAAALAEVIAQIRTGESRRTDREGQPPFDLTELPIPASFIGREDDLGWLLARLRAGQTSAVTALRGMGGIGKSTLAGAALRALYAEDRFRDGIAVVVCAGMGDPAAVLAAVLTRFDARRQPPQATALADLAGLARNELRGKRALVVLDNVEPELAAQEVVGPLRDAGLVVLLTARQQIARAAVPAEGSRELMLLSAGEALALFAQAYGRPVAEMAPAERAAAVHIVDLLLDRHTLAVQLAGVYAAGRDLDAVADELANPRRALELPDEKDVPDAMRRVFAASYDALDGDAQRLFAALACFATGDFGRQAALALARGLALERPAISVELLVRRALVAAASDATLPPDADRERLRLHPLLRAFAAATLARWPANERDAAMRAVAEWYAEYANEHYNIISALTADEANIIGALEWAHDQGEDDHDAEKVVVRICNGLRGFWRDTGRTRAGLRYLPWGAAAGERVAERSGDPTDRRRAANIALYYGDLLQNVGRLPEAEQAYQRDLALRREVQDRRGEGVDLYQLAMIAEARGDLDRAEALHRESLTIGIQVKSGPDVADSWLELGTFLIEHNRNHDEGCKMLRDAVSLYHEMGLPGEQEARARAQRLECLEGTDAAQ